MKKSSRASDEVARASPSGPPGGSHAGLRVLTLRGEVGERVRCDLGRVRAAQVKLAQVVGAGLDAQAVDARQPFPCRPHALLDPGPVEPLPLGHLMRPALEVEEERVDVGDHGPVDYLGVDARGRAGPRGEPRVRADVAPLPGAIPADVVEVTAYMAPLLVNGADCSRRIRAVAPGRLRAGYASPCESSSAESWGPLRCAR